MRACDIIKKKRDGEELTKEELSFMVKGAVSGEVLDYQISAFLMAVYFKGLTERETLDFTLEIASSGDVIESNIDGIKVDKHSTGGVGDKTSLIISPVVASCGFKVLKMSGRGLGHTGGTVDKLESIKNFNVELDANEFISVCEKTGLSIVSQTKNLAPADKIFYALRDVTATVDSIPLIASSIMGKKLTAKDDVIILDVKCGEGAFMKTVEDATKLASVMVKIGKGAGKKISAVITDMNYPLGNAVGNFLEVKEAIDVLKGKIKGRLYDVCKHLSAEILYLSGYGSFEDCEKAFDLSIESGRAYEKFKEFVNAQGGTLEEFDSDKTSKYKAEVYCNNSGYISDINALTVGNASLKVGAGRNKKEDKIDYMAGVVINKHVGDKVEKGDAVFTIYSSSNKELDNAVKLLDSAYKITIGKTKLNDIIIKTIR